MTLCDKIGKEAFHYIEGLVTAQERKEITAHLQNCPVCDKRYAQAREIHRSLHSMRKFKTSPHFNVVLQARLRKEGHRRRGQILWPLAGINWQVPAYAAAALCLVASGMFIDRVLEQRKSPAASSNLMSLETQASPAANRDARAAKKIQNYVMSPIPMEELMRINHRYAANQQGAMERRTNDTVRTRESNLQRPAMTPVREVSSPVRF
jgi:hypothetical protein